jgi:hypothetical protein
MLIHYLNEHCFVMKLNALKIIGSLMLLDNDKVDFIINNSPLI